jgi:DNA-binding NarL/FixJ family response regulator
VEQQVDTRDVVRRVALVEDHVLQRHRTREILAGQPDLVVVASCSTLPELEQWLQRAPAHQRPHLVLLDLSVDRGPHASPDTVRSLVRSGIKVLVLSALASAPLVRAVLRAGVSGVVGKRDAEQDVVDAVWAVLDGGEWMTPELAAVIAGDGSRPTLSDQEERALVLYASGLTMGAVAAAIGVKPDTAKTYLHRVKAKYAAAGRPVRSKLDIGRVAREDGYLDE